MLATLGDKQNMEYGEAAGFNDGKNTDFWIGTNDKGVIPLHVAFEAKNKVQVKKFYQTALAAGAKDNGAPGYRKAYWPGYYAAFVYDAELSKMREDQWVLNGEHSYTIRNLHIKGGTGVSPAINVSYESRYQTLYRVTTRRSKRRLRTITARISPAFEHAIGTAYDTACMAHRFVKGLKDLHVVPALSEFAHDACLETRFEFQGVGGISPPAAQQPARRTDRGLRVHALRHHACENRALRLRLTVATHRAVDHHAAVVKPRQRGVERVKRLTAWP